ncbi:MAG: PEP-CTERM sorting domain-containing protein [Planctomycetes bacterium]|jgi:hypothetical protein|nr:PEP-CTERM sorting domain-containing protein [Planctomycetota bacterium]
MTRVAILMTGALMCVAGAAPAALELNDDTTVIEAENAERCRSTDSSDGVGYVNNYNHGAVFGFANAQITGGTYEMELVFGSQDSSAEAEMTVLHDYNGDGAYTDAGSITFDLGISTNETDWKTTSTFDVTLPGGTYDLRFENTGPSSGASYNVDRLNIVPEPTTIACLGIGGLGVIIRRRRRYHR